MPKLSRLLGTVAAGAALALFAPAPALFANAADTLNCGDFQYQEDAQAELEKNPADPNNLDGNDDGVACESLPHRPKTTTEKPTATTTAPKPATTTKAADKDCADFATQAQAQAELNKNPADPNRLDADHDGYACESKFGQPTGQVKVKPSGGVDTGDGTSLPSENDTALVAGGAALAATAGAGAVLLVRRRARR
ncbi:excalibur calcium-binding domain-containing protein [Amycolatopsis sacchari]|uniref:Excalibur calcium-binding domain-containing protein n=1 Tax=Amycolatopsis sacchari TaxID=115433 RepID=A0A1I3LUT2_9PSEU|nr:excalibur calcium-binding domain-containing protein [Amycolatopsis sacchari]SFI88511.1 Excalibur calcium-binding domain-containing protein [Amycolatopsis sacchari]